ncbi:N-acetylglucosamine kinase [Kurthia sibirica]|uniref:N-acetylglucosamine kinase n=1 Tax=Kurthia sibirica TaxID=202750 RepID=UPI00116993A0|nr:ROK family protein [Kurthia sibirica]GEK33351.1 N-acetylmuramic acid/N-acetylglucosamine kinase [Kurthia sibirica]
MYSLAIDGGGTKTVAVIADHRGNIVAKTIVGRSNPTTLTQQQFEQTIAKCFDHLRAENAEVFAKVSCCFAGLSGVIEMSYEKIFKDVVLRYYDDTLSIIIENDACIALFSGTLGEQGVVQIAGTGSITYGLNQQRESARSGGWGYLFDDEGSGYDIAIQGLRSVVKAYDYRGAPTAITAKILQHFDVESVEEIIDQVYSSEHPRTIIAPLSKYVEEAALAGDAIAQKILENTCQSYLTAIRACEKQLIWSDNTPITVVLAGGIFTNFQLFARMMEQLISVSHDNYQFIKPQLLPIGGAIIGAFKQLNQPIDQQFIETFNKQYDER